MPRLVSNSEYLAGYISGKIHELQSLLEVLASPTELSENEMRNMRTRIDLIDASVRQQHRSISNPQVRPKLNMYEQILELSITELARREKHRGKQPPESDAMRARRIRNDDDYAPYASDGRGPVPLEYWTVVNPAPRRAPVSADDLRLALGNRRSGRDDRDNWATVPNQERPMEREKFQRERPKTSPRNDGTEAGPSGIQRIRDQSRSRTSSAMDTSEDRHSNIGRHNREDSPGSARSRSSMSSYVSTRQSVFSRAQRGVPLPPISERLPHPINRLDSELIGRSEVYVRRAGSATGCPMCGRDHRMYRCDEFMKLNLRERWYESLRNGVCLNCLRHGHSSFTCLRPGACNRCGSRHNSLLCPRHPSNR